MMRRISILFLFSFFLILNLPSESCAGIPTDSLRTKWMNGKKYILHKVEPGETWSHLSRRYKNSVEDLMGANKGIEYLKIGQIVNIPVETASPEVQTADQTPATPKKTTNEKQVPLQDNRSVPVVHTVKQGETLFSIARKFEQNVEEIKKFNNLTNDNIRIDQKLIVRYISNSGNQEIAKTETQMVIVPPAQPKEKSAMASADVKELSAGTESTTEKIEKPSEAVTPATASGTATDDTYFFDKPTKSVTTLKKGSSGKSVVQVTETGVATWIVDGQNDNGKFFGLHRSAPIGTIIKVTNRMNNQSVYVKVVGVLPDTGENEKVIIKLSQAVKEKLNALDPFFQVELTYGMMR